jgi:SAM-dependent MidA family methyltransferase
MHGRRRPVELTDRAGPPPGSQPRRGADSNPELVALLRDEIEREGGITFARFMGLVLYHPEHGYYVRSADRATRSGDYLSAPETHPLFGRAIARQLDEMWRLLDRPRPFTLREYGPGTGSLGEAVLGGLRAEGSPLLESIRYQPLEVAPARAAAIAERLAAAGFGAALSPPDRERPLTGCILANELLDALPVHRVELVDGELRELYVGWRDGWFADEPGEPSTGELARYLERAEVRLREGQQAEINLSAVAWIAEVAARLARGYLLVIDYGHPAAELYGPRRPRGTLLAYRRHRVSDDPYQAVGEQDLTSHVDLTTVEHAAEAAGLRLLGRTTQAEFLAGLGLGELLEEIGRHENTDVEAYVAARAAVLRFLDPRALGRFAVLVFGRDVPPGPLRGLTFRLAG